MRKLLVLLCSMLLLLGMAWPAGALLFDRGGGLIYDNVLDVTWLQDANYPGTLGLGWNGTGKMYWDDALAWADQLVYQRYDDWRLPKALPINGYDYVISSDQPYNGSIDFGYNITAPGSVYPGSTKNEMAYMYYNNLQALGYFAVQTIGPPDYLPLVNDDWGVKVTDPFINLNVDTNRYYWSGSSSPPDNVYGFNFYLGKQDHSWFRTFTMANAWAVRDGDSTPVPEPATILLLGAGLVGLAGLGRKRFKKNNQTER